MNALGVTLVWCAAQVSVLGMAAWGLLYASRRTSPAARSLLAFSGMVTVVLLTVLALFPLPSWWDVAAKFNAPPVVAAEPPAAIETDVADSNSLAADRPLREPAADAPVDTAEAPALGAELLGAWLDELQAAGGDAEATAATWRWPSVLAAVAVGIWVVGGWNVLAGLATVRRYRKSSAAIDDKSLCESVDLLCAELRCRRRIAVCRCDALATAATIGWLRPTILLPPEWKDWNKAQLRAVLAHEIAHIARHDFAACLGAQLGLALHFYHPVVHWLASRMRLEQELAADAAAASVAGGQSTYLKILAELALRQPERRVGWPARSFLPTRRTFLRRIEMLRDAKRVPAMATKLWQVTTIAVLAMAAILAAGLRNPSDRSQAQAAEPLQPIASAVVETKPFDTSYFSDESGLVIALRPAALLQHRGLQELSDALDESANPLADWLGLPAAEIDQVMIEFPQDRKTRGAFVARATKPHDWKHLIGESKDAVERQHHGKTYFLSADESLAIFRPDDRTVVVAKEEAIRRYLAGNPPQQTLVRSSTWQKVHNDHLAIAVSRRYVEQVGRQEVLQETAVASSLSPLFEHADAAFLGARVGAELNLQGYVVCDDANGAKEVAETISASLTLGRNMVRQAAKNTDKLPAIERDFIVAGLQIAEELLDGAKVDRIAVDEGAGKRRTVFLHGQANFEKIRLGPLSKAVIAARAAAQRSQAMNNLRQLAIAMHNYHEAHGHLPPAVMLGPDGRTPHSWRVALLPHLGKLALYKQYRFAETWDSEHNKTILAQMPDVFRSPFAPAGSTNSAYFVLTGEATPYSAKPSKEGVGLLHITDGTANTIMLVEAQREIPWTKPEDIAYDAAKPLPKLGGIHKSGFNVVFCDAHVVFFHDPVDEARFRTWITKSAGEPGNAPAH